MKEHEVYKEKGWQHNQHEVFPAWSRDVNWYDEKVFPTKAAALADLIEYHETRLKRAEEIIAATKISADYHRSKLTEITLESWSENDTQT